MYAAQAEKRIEAENKAIEGFFREKLNGREIRVREKDGYICVTDICKAVDEAKKIHEYFSVERHRDYREEVARVTGEATSDLLEIKRGGDPKAQGTWAHPLIAIDVARWASPKLALEMNSWFMKYVKGDLSAVQELLKRSEVIREVPVAVAATSSEMVVVEGDGKARDDLLKTIQSLKDQLAKKDLIIAKKNARIERRDRKIDNLEAKIDELLRRSERTLDQNDDLKRDVHRLHVKVDRIAVDAAPKYGTPDRNLPALYIYADRKTKNYPYLAIRAQEKAVRGLVRRQEKRWNCSLVLIVRISSYADESADSLRERNSYANAVTLYSQFRDLYGKYMNVYDKSPNWFELNELAERDGWGEEEMADCVYDLAKDRFN